MEIIQRSLLDMKLAAEAIARSPKNHEYSEVYTPDEEDESVRDFILMQQDHKKKLRVIKQQICAFTTRHGYMDIFIRMAEITGRRII